MPIEQLLEILAGPGRRAVPDAHAHALRDRARDVLRRAGQHEHELVAAVAGDPVVGTDLRAQGVRHAAQHGVAGRVAELVVDALEVVEVDQHAAERLAVARGPGDLLAHPDLHRTVVQQAGQRIRARRGANVVVGLGVVAGDHREVGDRLEHAQVVARDLAAVEEADREGSAQLAVPAHRHAHAGAHAGQDDVGRKRHVLLVRGRDDRLPGREHLAGDPLAGCQPVAEPLVRAVVARRRQPVAVDVDQVDARHRAVDGEAGLARERVEHGLQLERHVERVGGPRQRLVPLGLGDAALLGLEPRQPERSLVGERLGDQDLVRAPDARGPACEHRDVAHVARPRERHEQGAAGLEPRRALGAQIGHRA